MHDEKESHKRWLQCVMMDGENNDDVCESLSIVMGSVEQLNGYNMLWPGHVIRMDEDNFLKGEYEGRNEEKYQDVWVGGTQHTH